MAARRNKRKQRRRGRFGFLYKVLSIAIILVAVIMGCAVFFRVDKIEVSGQSRYTAEQIIEAAEVEQGDNLFALDKFKTSKQILTRLPYIDGVSISRRLPDGLMISVTECAPAAAIEAEGAWWILNAGGKFLERTDINGATGLAVITGLTPIAPMVGTKLEVSEEQAAKLGSLSKLFQALESRSMTAQTGSFDLTADNVILMGYTNRFTVKLPMSGTDFSREMKTIQAAVESLPESKSGILDFTLAGDPHLIPYS